MDLICQFIQTSFFTLRDCITVNCIYLTQQAKFKKQVFVNFLCYILDNMPYIAQYTKVHNNLYSLICQQYTTSTGVIVYQCNCNSYYENIQDYFTGYFCNFLKSVSLFGPYTSNSILRSNTVLLPKGVFIDPLIETPDITGRMVR